MVKKEQPRKPIKRKPTPEEMEEGVEPSWKTAHSKRYADITIDGVRDRAEVCAKMSAQLKLVANQMEKQGVRHLTVEGGGKMDRGVDLVDRFIRNLETSLIRCRESLRG